jgi:HK97 family phage prohead protease/HK97 family phage major capsid protein
MKQKSVRFDGLKAGPKDGLEEGQFEAYASVFGNRDLTGDVIVKGAFAKSLAEWEKRSDYVPVLYGHNDSDPDFNIGHVVTAVEDSHGLKIRAQLDLESPKGVQLYRMIKGRRINQMSFAYDVLDSAPVKSADGRPSTELRELALHEVSVVPRGANPATEILAVKSAPKRALTLQIAALAMKGSTTMNRKDRDSQLSAAQTIIDAATELQRDLTDDEAATVEKHLDAVKSFDAGEHDAAQTKSRDEAVRAAAKALAEGVGKPSVDENGRPTTNTVDKSGTHLALSGKHAKATAARIVAKVPVDHAGRKAVVAAGQITTGIPMVAEPVAQGRPATSILDVLHSQEHSTPVWKYLRQVVRTFNAAPVAPYATKQTSEIELETVDGELHVVAHLSSPVDKYVLSDTATLQKFIETEMLYGLRLAVEAQVLSGNGSGENLTGILATSGIQTQAFATSILLSARKAITKLETNGYTPGLFTFSPEDWEAIESLVSTDSAVTYQGLPIDREARKLHGVPVTVSNALPDSTGLLLDTESVDVDTDTDGIEILWFQINDDASKNQSRCRVEGRFEVSVTLPQGIVKIDTAAA